jgi:hypothetical protein
MADGTVQQRFNFLHRMLVMVLRAGDIVVDFFADEALAA